EWFYPYYSLPTVTEKEDTIDIFKPGKYTITYTIPKSYYADNNSLTYTLTVKDPNASLDVTSGTFDKYNSNENNKDISVKLDKGKYDLTSITNGETVLTKGTDYSVSEDTYTFPISYLSTLENGDNVITFNMSGGTSPTLTINVQDSTPIDAGLDSSETIFDKTMGSDDYDDVLVKLNPGSYSLLSINDNDYSLVQDQDYTNKENDYTIKKEYFKNIDEGDHNFVFKMSGGTSPQFTVHIVKSKDINASVTPTSATFDKNKNSKNHKDIQVLLDPVVYQINGIKNGNYTLVKGKDYSVKENKPFVENSINKSLDLGNLKELSKSNYNKFSILDNKENIHSKEALKNKSNNLNKDVFNLGINKTSYTNDEMDDVLYLIRDDYLDTLKPGTHKLTFDVSSGVDPVFTINISDTTKKKDDKNNGKNDGKSDSDKKDTGNKSDGNKGGSSSSNGGSGKIKNINSGSKPVKTGDYANTTEAIMFILIGLGLLCYVAKRVNRRN
ncbi:MAG: hypothetical protein LBM02_02400, partial [Lachnospiraceae bacterium]|nr:hypothetical protein [Lachnospiraceae bacterium]